MFLKVRKLRLLTGRPVAVLHSNIAKKLSIYVGERLRIKKEHSIVAVVDTAEGMIKEDEIELSAEIIHSLKLKEGDLVEVSAEPPPKAAKFILEKLNGKELDKEKLGHIVGDIVHNTLTEAEIAYFISGVYVNGMTEAEIANFTKAMVSFGETLDFGGKVYDKHSIGGVAGNRTTPLIVSICAAAGLIMPKTSSRAITSAAGTADVVEVLAKVDFSVSEIKKILRKANACLVWGGAIGFSPADDKIIQVERIINLDPEAQLLASILSKKLAVKSKGVLIDISYGESAKIKTRKDAENLAKKFRNISKLVGLNLKVILTDGSQPVGNGIGPVLEARDIVAVLSRSPTRPLDLEEKAVMLSGIILELSNKAKPGKGKKLAREILDSGKAYQKFEQIIKAQGGKLDGVLSRLKPARFSYEVLAEKSGIVKSIDNKKIASVAFSAGCPADKASGIYLHVHNGRRVKKGESLTTLYAETEEKLSFAKETYNNLKPIVLR